MFRLFECCALSFFERFVLSFSLKIERFVSDSAEIWICGLYEYTLINELAENNKLPSLCTVINGLDLKRRKYGYYYGYGKYGKFYGYGKRYGYGYGYGEHFHDKES